jgi:hypothetical protein
MAVDQPSGIGARADFVVGEIVVAQLRERHVAVLAPGELRNALTVV